MEKQSISLRWGKRCCQFDLLLGSKAWKLYLSLPRSKQLGHKFLWSICISIMCLATVTTDNRNKTSNAGPKVWLQSTSAETSDNLLTMYNSQISPWKQHNWGKNPTKQPKRHQSPQKTPNNTLASVGLKKNKVLDIESSRSARVLIDRNNQTLRRNQVHKELVRPFL